MISKTNLARLSGAIYLVVAITGGFSELYARASVKVPGDAAATAENIRASATLFGIGFVSDVVSIASLMLLAIALYALLSPVNRTIASAFVLINAIAVAVMSVNMLNHAGALAVATNPSYAAALGAASADALAVLFLDLHHQGYLVAQVFFGGWLLPLGYLVYKSGYFPRVLGIGLMVGCFAYLAELAATYMSPGFETGSAIYLVIPAAVAEISFLLWLLVMGAKVERQGEPAQAAVRAQAITTV